MCIICSNGMAFQEDPGRYRWTQTSPSSTAEPHYLDPSTVCPLSDMRTFTYYIMLSDTMTGQCLGLLTGQTIMQTIRFLLDHSRNGHGHKRFLCGLPTQKRDWNSCPRTIKLNSLRLILVVWDCLAMCLCSRRRDAEDRRLCWSFSACSAGTQMKCCPVLSYPPELFCFW